MSHDLHAELVSTAVYFVPLLLLPLCLSFVDFVTAIRAGRKGGCTRIDRTLSEWDFSILVPIFGDLRYLKNLDFLAGYGAKVVLCTTSGESAEFRGGFVSARSGSAAASVTPW